MLEKAAVRLLTLDFLLAGADHEYLEEEKDKVDCFTRERSFTTEILPVNVFAGAQGAETRQYFFKAFPNSSFANRQPGSRELHLWGAPQGRYARSAMYWAFQHKFKRHSLPEHIRPLDLPLSERQP